LEKIQSSTNGNFKFCKTIAFLDSNIVGTGMIWKGQLVAMFSKANALPPSPERFHGMLVQTSIIWSMIKQNEDFFWREQILCNTL
jgi:hypothetical protein